MIQDFWLGVLAASVVALGLIAIGAATLAIVSVRWLSRYASIELGKGPTGQVDGSFTVRGTGEPPT